jgi:hypothetical protein
LKNDIASFLMTLAVANVSFAWNSAALAIEPGHYLCQIEKARGVTAQHGRSVRLRDAPASFLVDAADGPIFGDDLLQPPRALDVYNPETGYGFVVRSPAGLFSSQMTGLRSTDGRTYSQADMTILFLDGERFIAYGLLDTQSFAGVAIYSGACKVMQGEK